ncbi:LacI family DNA-binding transcriptional regulator [Tessaracoccus sp. MC1865]|uniref:LacI family DNA-binding transcriptional regulator n=1 Tax=Tessaracoccus sp. MC1865 TaxID=2760310 RepID=UPI001600E6A1|nr:LacI family DNA-binding transcriptional regulator [Tessaracoccus sp. MC1865]MBB1482928.1 LacI family DNA-binding transcriptional regulator [Tessaracoccus sp. MC1865]QTO37633.1 LacI family DNA-binding transcriptional regulator [Tessaracoccus sp. MC1865]
MPRPTIKDISRIAGVSPTAVSFALNNRPGVSESTRARVLQVAQEIGWHRSVAAAALSAGRAQAVGMVLPRPTGESTGERFLMHLIAGIEEVLTAHALALVLQFIVSPGEELETYRRWHFERRVDGVILTDPVVDDPRPAILEELTMPAVLIGSLPGNELPNVRVDDAAAMRFIVDHLAVQGHRRITHVPAPPNLIHTLRRSAAFAESCRELGIETPRIETNPGSINAGQAITQQLLMADNPPTAIIYDNEGLMLGGLGAITAMGVRIPDDVAIVSFEDSTLCRVASPPITSLAYDPAGLGAEATTLLLDLLGGEEPREVVVAAPMIQVRGSTQTRS